MASYDDGSYSKVVLEGDVHTTNQEAAGLPTRSNAKTFIYGFLYGAGDEKIGKSIGKGSGEGRKIKKKFLTKLPALKYLMRQKNVAGLRDLTDVSYPYVTVMRHLILYFKVVAQSFVKLGMFALPMLSRKLT
jgi:hypothetical protein